jgi:hypothetical protein
MSYVTSWQSETSYDYVREWALARRLAVKKKQSRELVLFWSGGIAGALFGSVWLSAWMAWILL